MFEFSQNESSFKSLVRLVLVLGILLWIFNRHYDRQTEVVEKTLLDCENHWSISKTKGDPKKTPWGSPYLRLCVAELKTFVTNPFLRGKQAIG